jgi:rhodanese-related sulfurtransferase
MVTQIRPSELSAWIQSLPAGREPMVLDVREPWECQTASVTPDGFALQAIPMHEIPARLDELDAEQPVACLCHHGARSQRVALFLHHQGFGQVVNLSGGIDAWSLERDPTVPRY